MKMINDTIYSKGNPVIDFGYYDPRTKQPYSSLLNASLYLLLLFDTIPIGLTICVNENELIEYWWIGNLWKAKATISDVLEVIDNIPQPESISIKNFTVYYLGNHPPTANSIEAEYNFSTNVLTIITTGITLNKPTGSNIYYYKGTTLSNSNSIIWEGPFREITDLELINQMSVSSTYPLRIYKVANSQPEIPTNIVFTYNNGVVTYTLLNGWLDTIPQTTGGKIYVSYNNLILIQNTPSDTPTYNGDMTGWTTPVEYLDLNSLLEDVINTNNEEYKRLREQAIADLEDWLNGLSTDIGDAQNTLDEIAAIQQQIDNGQLDLTGILSNLDNISKLLVTNGWAQYKIYYIKYNDQYICYLNDTFLATTSNTNAVFVLATEIITGGYYIKQIYQGDIQFTVEDYVSLNPVSNTFNFDLFVGVTLEENLLQSGSFLYSKQVLDALNGEFLTQAAAINPSGAFKTAIQAISSEKIRSELTSISGQTIKQAVQSIADKEIANTVGELTNDLKINLTKFLQSPNGITLEALGGNININITSWKLLSGPIHYLAAQHQEYIESTLRQGYTTINGDVVRFKPIPYILNNLLQFGQFVYLVLEDGSGTNLYMWMDYNGNLTTGILNSDGELIIGIGTYSATKNSVESAMMNIIKNRIRLSVTSLNNNSASFTIGIKDYNGNSYADIDADIISLTGLVLANAITTESLNVNNSTYLLNNGSAAFGKYSTYFDLTGDGYLANGLILWGSKRLYIYSNSNKTVLLLTLQVADIIENSETIVLDINGTEKTFKLKKSGDKWGLINNNNSLEYAYYDDINKKWLSTTSTIKWLDTIYYNGNGLLSVKGLIVATGGQIGGWTIVKNALTTTYNNYTFTIDPGDINAVGYMGVVDNNDTKWWLLSANGTASFCLGAVVFENSNWHLGTPNDNTAQISYDSRTGRITIGSNVDISGELTANRINISKLVGGNTVTDYAGIDGPTKDNNKVIWSGGSRDKGNPTFYVTDEGEIFGSKGTLSVINNNYISDYSTIVNTSDLPEAFIPWQGEYYVFDVSKVGDIVYLPNVSIKLIMPFAFVESGADSEVFMSTLNVNETIGRRVLLIGSGSIILLVGLKINNSTPTLYYEDSNKEEIAFSVNLSDENNEGVNIINSNSNPENSTGIQILDVKVTHLNNFMKVYSLLTGPTSLCYNWNSIENKTTQYEYNN